MKKRLATFITLALVTIYTVGLSQNRDSLGVKKFILTTSVLEYIPGQLNAGNFNIGSEVYLKKGKAINFNLGFIKSYGPLNRTGYQALFVIPSTNTVGFRIQLEGKYYLNKHKIIQPLILLFWPHILQFKSQELQNTGYYVAFHSSYRFTKTDRKENVLEFNSDDPFGRGYYRENNYSVNRNAVQLHLKIGYQSIKKYGLVVDYAVGFGIEYVSSYANNKLGNNGKYEIFPNKLFDSGDGFFPSFVYQVRIGWAH